MPYDASKGRMVANTTASAKARSLTLGPGGSYPAGDREHQILAEAGAKTAERAGHLSPAQAASIESKARVLLAKGK